MQDEMCINSSQTDEQSSTEEEECDSGEVSNLLKGDEIIIVI